MIIWWPSLAETIELHAAVMELDGSRPHHCDASKLAGALYRPRNLHFYQGLNDIVELAVTLAASLAHAHAFTDGNKRTAYAALVVFLEGNGLETTIPVEDLSIAQGIEKLVDAFHEGESAGDAQVVTFASILRTVVRNR